MAKDMYGIKAPKRPSFTDPMSAGVNMEQQSLNNAVNVRNEYDDDAELFTNLSKIGGDKPRGGAANFITGLAEGAAYGSKTKSTEKKQEALSKYDKVLDYFRQVNNQAMEMKEWYQKREFAKQKYMPQVMAYAENINKLDPQSQRMMAQGILDGWNRTTGDDYKLNTIDGSDPFVMTISSDKGTQIIDIRDLFAGDEVLQQRLAMKTPEYQMKLQQERQDKDREFKLKEDKLALESQYAPEKYAVQREKLEQTTRRNDQNAVKMDTKLSETLGKKIDSSREFLTIVPKMEDIIKNHPDIFQSAIDATWRENEEPGYIDNLVKDVQNKWNPEKVAALTSMVKYINKMTLDVANGFARPNMFIEKIGSKAVPNLDMNPQGFLKVLQEMKQENETSIKNNLARFDLLKSDMDNGLSDQYKESTNDVMALGNSNNQNQTVSGTRIMIKTPDGTKMRIPESYLDQAIANGAEVIDG